MGPGWSSTLKARSRPVVIHDLDVVAAARSDARIVTWSNNISNISECFALTGSIGPTTLPRSM
jgi:hypothetical protein